MNVMGILVFGLLAGALQADLRTDTADGRKLFFEPTQADYDCCAAAIHEQQHAYEKAKIDGNYAVAIENSLFSYQEAWLHFNLAMSKYAADEKGFYNDESRLKGLLVLLDRAEEAIANDPKHKEAIKCKKLVKRNRVWIEKRIAELAAASK